MSQLKKTFLLIWLFHKKLVKYTLIFILSVVALCVLLSALLAGTLYYANRHGLLQNWLNQSLKTVEISYQHGAVSWHHLDPSITLTGVHVMEKQAMTEPLSLDSIMIDFSIWRSLLHWQLVTDNLTVSGIKLNVEQDTSGQFQLKGLSQSTGSVSPYQPSPALLRWFFAQNGMHLNDALLTLHLRNGESLNLHIDEMNWLRSFGYHFDLKGHVLEIPDSALTLDANFVPGENPFDLEGWHVSFNGSFTGKDFTPLFLKQNLYNIAWLSGGGSVNFHGSWDNDAVQELEAYIDLNNVNLGRSNSRNVVSPTFDETVQWRAQTNGGWTLTLKPASAIGAATPALMTVLYNPEAPQAWKMTAQDMDLQMIGQWVQFWFLPDSYVAKAWNNFHPNGNVSNLNISIGNASGTVLAEAKNLAISPNSIFPEGLPQSDVSVKMSWQEGVPNFLKNITVNAITVSNPWLNLSLSGGATLNSSNFMDSTVNITGTLAGQNLEEVKAVYLPEAFVPEALRDWLLHGLVKVPKLTGSFALKGALADFPYVDSKKGLFQIALHAIGAEIAPWPEWPELKGISADILFKNQKFTVDSGKVETLGVPLHQVHLEIDDLRPHKIKDIVVTGYAEPTGEQALNYIATMPLTDEKMSAWLESLSLTGSIPLKLHLVIPLEEGEPIVATGDATLSHNDWALEANEAPLLTDITGHLHFVNDVISIPDLQFDAFGQSLAARIPAEPLTHLKLFFEHFVFLGEDFPGLEMDFISEDNTTTLTFKHPLVTGTLHLTGEQQDIEAHFTEFHLPLAGDEVQQNTPTLLGEFLSHIPPLSIVVDQLYYGEMNLGRFSLGSTPLSNGIEVNHLNLNGKYATLVTAGRIQTEAQEDHFEVSGVLNSNNYGELLKSLNFPGLVNGGSGRINFDLGVGGAIEAPDLSTLNGSLNFNLTDGKLLKVNTGLARIFGLVSLDTIFSTLSLNFGKMLSNGLTFDTMEGGYAIHQGVATATDKGVRIVGPSLTLTLKGKVDFVNKTLRQTATVMPQVGTSIAIAAAFVGGPVAGVATWFADKLLGSTLFKNTGITYNVTGSFNEPVVSLFKPSASS